MQRERPYYCQKYHRGKTMLSKRKQKEQETDIRQALLIFNDCAQRVDLYQKQFFLELERIKIDATGYKDIQSMDEAAFLLAQFQDTRNSICLKLDGFRTSYEHGNRKDLLAEICSIREQVDQMEEYCLSIKAIQPSRQKKPESGITDLSYFYGCSTRQILDKRYRALSKAFHPDSSFGNRELFEQMQKEYEKEKEKFL